MNILNTQYLKLINCAVANHRLLYLIERNYCFKSAYSLDKLYPNSNLKITSPEFVPDRQSSKFSGYIPVDELDIKCSTSSAPGGQNVNRVNTKVDLRFQVSKANWLTTELKEKLIEQNKTKITKEGYLIIKSEVTRSQQLNLADALEKLRNLIRKAEKTEIAPISEEQEEVLRKRHLKFARERLLVKRIKSQTKQNRASIKPSDIL